MAEKKYQTIDPLILETLNLNEKRIHHIFDILHGRDARPDTQRILRSATIHTQVSSKLPKLRQQQLKTKPIRTVQPRPTQPKKQRNYSASLIEYSGNKQVLEGIEQERRGKHPKKGKEKGQPGSLVSPFQVASESFSQVQERRGRLIQDYGTNKIRNSKSLELNPKDIYRIEIQNLVGKLTQIEELEDAQKLMKRLKRRYQHLRRFDQHYYSKLNQTQFLFL